jgi:hypothetical protein
MGLPATFEGNNTTRGMFLQGSKEMTVGLALSYICFTSAFTILCVCFSCVFSMVSERAPSTRHGPWDSHSLVVDSKQTGAVLF